MAQNDGQGVEKRSDVIFYSLRNQNSHGGVIQEGHFLTPSFPIGNMPLPKLGIDVISKKLENCSSYKLALNVDCYGWQNPNRRWCQWVDDMLLIHRDTWKRAGILESIQATRFKIHRSQDVIFSLARKWNPETSSFVFPWGEASITLEDVYILGGFSVTGDPVPLSVPADPNMTRVQDRFVEVRKMMNRSSIKKATYSLWLKTFTNKDDNIYRDIEHEAFLTYWLSKYVFPRVKDTVGIHVQATAIHLARGTRIALAPAVLASLYSEMRMIRESISMCSVRDLDIGEEFTKFLWSPMHLIQLWAWERFQVLGPKPKNIELGNPRVARWHDLKPTDIDDIARVLNKAGLFFEWRPYCTVLDNWAYEFHEANNKWIEVDVRRGHKLEAFAMFIRHSELVGFEGSIEQYLPHRVARQFGMDQDIPDYVPRFNDTKEIAWSQYNRTLEGTKLYIPPLVCNSKVTVRYSSWWKDLKKENKKELKGLIIRRESISVKDQGKIIEFALSI